MTETNMHYDVYTNHGHRYGFAESIEIPDEGGLIQIHKPGNETIWLAPGTFDEFRIYPAKEDEFDE